MTLHVQRIQPMNVKVASSKKKKKNKSIIYNIEYT